MFKWYYFGYVGLIKMYIKINFIFFNVAMKHLGLIDVARISYSDVKVGAPNSVHTLSYPHTSPHRIFKKFPGFEMSIH